MGNEAIELVKGNGTMVVAISEKDPLKFIKTFIQKWELDIENNELMIYAQGGTFKPYITKSGYTHLANIHGISTKIEVMKMKNIEPYMVMVKCTAIKKDGTSHEDFGICESTEPGRGNKPISAILGMAVTRARNRSLNAALNVRECAFEEMSQEDMKNMKDPRTIIEVEANETSD